MVGWWGLPTAASAVVLRHIRRGRVFWSRFFVRCRFWYSFDHIKIGVRAQIARNCGFTSDRNRTFRKRYGARGFGGRNRNRRPIKIVIKMTRHIRYAFSDMIQLIPIMQCINEMPQPAIGAAAFDRTRRRGRQLQTQILEDCTPRGESRVHIRTQ